MKPKERAKPPKGWTYAKIGTMPMLVQFDGRCRWQLGSSVRWKESTFGKWQTGILDKLEPKPFVSRM